MAGDHGEARRGPIDPIRRPARRGRCQGEDCPETCQEIEKSGLELYAGFKGNVPVSLDSLAPSGGERTVAIIAFLLSLQQYVESPFRAIDEFDVHMDPKNRETVTKLIYAASTSNEPGEYIAITPAEVTLTEGQDVHVVVVQNVEGTSVVKELK